MPRRLAFHGPALTPTLSRPTGEGARRAGEGPPADQFSEDAPALESQLHKHFIMQQINKVNHRKEFFRADLQHIREETEKLGLTPEWTMAARAAQYRETLAIEKAITRNPAMREAWVKRQLQLELLGDNTFETDDQSMPIPQSQPRHAPAPYPASPR